MISVDARIASEPKVSNLADTQHCLLPIDEGQTWEK